MAGNDRGKLKEHLEGIHRNYDWVVAHCTMMLGIIGEQKPDLSAAIKALGEQTKILDDLSNNIYSTL